MVHQQRDGCHFLVSFLLSINSHGSTNCHERSCDRVNHSQVNTKAKPGGSRVPLNDRGRHSARAPTQTRQWVWDLLRSPCETGDRRWWKMALPHIAGPSYFSPRIGYAIPKYEPLNWPVYRPFFLFLFYMIEETKLGKKNKSQPNHMEERKGKFPDS